MAIGNELWLERNERTNENLGDAGTSHTNYGGHLSAPKELKRKDMTFQSLTRVPYGNNRAPAGRSRESGADHSKKFVTVKPNQLICLSLTNPLRGPLYTHVTEPNTPHVRGAVRSLVRYPRTCRLKRLYTHSHTHSHPHPTEDRCDRSCNLHAISRLAARWVQLPMPG